MKNLRLVIVGGFLTASLVIAATPAMADPPGLHKGWENHPGLHKGWEKNHHGRAKGDDGDGDRYEHHYRHDAYHGTPYPYRYPSYGYRDPYYYRHDMHYDRGAYPSTAIHNNVSNVPAARQALADNRQQVKNNVQQLKKDKAELRKDIRNRASRTEIAQDRAAIRQDKQNVSDSKKEVRQSQKDLKLAR
jgi:Spy/CpxP family protein refolding chaperone